MEKYKQEQKLMQLKLQEGEVVDLELFRELQGKVVDYDTENTRYIGTRAIVGRVGKDNIEMLRNMQVGIPISGVKHRKVADRIIYYRCAITSLSPAGISVEEHNNDYTLAE